MKKILILLAVLFAFTPVQAQFQNNLFKIAKFDATKPAAKNPVLSETGYIVNARVDTTEWKNIPDDTLGWGGYISAATPASADSVQVNVFLQWGLPGGPDTTLATRAWLPAGGSLVMWQHFAAAPLSFGKSWNVAWWLKPAGVVRYRYIVTFGASKNGVDGDASARGLQVPTYNIGETYHKGVR